MKVNKYIIKLDFENNILQSLCTFDYTIEDVEISEGEYDQSKQYKKFNSKTREFYEENIVKQEELSDKQRIEQLEAAIGVLAEQLAKQSLEL